METVISLDAVTTRYNDLALMMIFATERVGVSGHREGALTYKTVERSEIAKSCSTTLNIEDFAVLYLERHYTRKREKKRGGRGFRPFIEASFLLSLTFFVVGALGVDSPIVIECVTQCI